MMKRLLYPLLAAIPVLLASCEESHILSEDYTPLLTGHYLYLGTRDIQLSATDNSQQDISIVSTDASWKFSGMPKWLSLSTDSGVGNAKVKVSAAANLSGDTVRTCILSFESTDPEVTYRRNVSVTQAAATPYISVDQTSPTFTASASSLSLSVSANTVWTLVMDGGESWLTALPSEDRKVLMLSVKENTTSATRKAILQLVGAVTRTVTVVQAAPSTPIPEAQNLSFGNVGDVRPFIVTSEVSWRATSSESWIQLTPSEGEAGTSIMNIEVTPNTSLNDRSGFVYIHIADRQVLSITVTQEGLSLKLSPEKLSFAADTESQKLQVTCNTEWSVLESPDWLSVSSTSGSGDMTLTLTAADYWNTSSRQGILRIGREGTDLQAQVTLTQEGRIFPNLIESLLFDALPSSQTVAIQTDGRWTTMISEAWIHVTPEKGTGDGNLQISVDENNNANEREGHISVTVGQITHTIVVTQQGRYFTVTPTTGTTLPSTGGKHQVHIAGNDPWTAKSSSSWIKLSATSGDSDIDVTLTASDNPSIHERKDTTVFTPAHLQPVKVVTTQQGRYLTVDVTSLSFFAQGGESEAITVNTDGTFTVTSSDDWITISQKGKTFTVTATENTTTEERRGLVTVSMTGLIEGESYRVEIPISQKAVSGVDISPFGDDQKWDPSYDDSGNLDVTPFTDDKSWD